MDYSFNNIKSNLFWEVTNVNYTEIDSKIIDKYFFTELNINAKISIVKLNQIKLEKPINLLMIRFLNQKHCSSSI